MHRLRGLPKRSDEEQKSGTPAALARARCGWYRRASRRSVIDEDRFVRGQNGLHLLEVDAAIVRLEEDDVDRFHELIDGIDDLDAERLHSSRVVFFRRRAKCCSRCPVPCG